MMETTLYRKLEEGRDGLAKLCPRFPKIVVTLGSGLAGLLDDMEVETEFPFHAIPHVKTQSVAGHKGRVVVGKLAGVRIAAMQGRLHFYEGHTMEEVVFPFRVFGLAGAQLFFLTNATGGIRPDMKPLDLMLIRDHINLMGDNPLTGPNDDRLGPRFPDMSEVYDRTLSETVLVAAKKAGVPLLEGVYVAIKGPSYETPAEIRMFRACGGDVVGMSTVPEAIAIRHMGKKIVGVSVVTNLAAGVHQGPLEHEDVLEQAPKIYKAMGRLFSEALPLLAAKLP